MSRTFRLGVFIVASLAMLAGASFLIGQRQLLFAHTDEVRTSFSTVAGLVKGAEVRIGGIHEGIVSAIDLPDSPDQAMTVRMKVDRSARGVIRVDSIASIGTEGLLGQKFVEISFGSPGAEPLPPSGVIASAPSEDLADVVKKTNDVLEAAKGAMGDVQASASSLKDISEKIDAGTGTIGALVNDRRVFDRLSAATSQASLAATAFHEDMEALKHNFFLRGFFNDRGYLDSAQLTAYLITQLPQDAPGRSFRYDVTKLFENVDHAKLKNGKALDDAGRFLQQAPFKLAVVVASSGLKGDSADLQALLQARAMVIREYLVKNFRMDDTHVKTMIVGKTAQTATDAGTIDLLVYPMNRQGR